jgi:hypothetical protein
MISAAPSNCGGHNEEFFFVDNSVTSLDSEDDLWEFVRDAMWITAGAMMSSECETPVVLDLLWGTQNVALVRVQDLTGPFR